MKKFLITIDTEGDNLWEWKMGMPIKTENTRFLERFQKLCEKYNFKPVWLSNYEMLNDPGYIDFISRVEEEHTGELGMHLHAWNTPPEYELPVIQPGHPYLIEYPVEIMEEKVEFMTSLIKKRCGIDPVTHRSGRWAMNQQYYDLLIKHGYKVDCSVTPHINWKPSVGRTKGACGSDYTDQPESVYMVSNSEHTGNIMEVPMTIRHKKIWISPENRSLINYARSAYHMIRGVDLWMRPMGDNLNALKKLITSEKDSEYMMFMIHSSELMPGGSPTFRTEESIEILYRNLEEIFSLLSQTYKGCTLREFYYEKMGQEKIKE